jgi:hypothetical protein
VGRHGAITLSLIGSPLQREFALLSHKSLIAEMERFFIYFSTDLANCWQWG